jgi:hypothetical protein
MLLNCLEPLVESLQADCILRREMDAGGYRDELSRTGGGPSQGRLVTTNGQQSAEDPTTNDITNTRRDRV